MKILVLGGDGMLGHELLTQLSERHNVKVTLRGSSSVYEKWGLFNQNNSYFSLEITNRHGLMDVLNEFKPEAVVNAIGIVKQRKEAKDIIPSLEVNALFPHELAQICDLMDARLVHVSTDCVFSGKKGNYIEQDFTDCDDVYGRSKLMGEVGSNNTITLRTSIIGLELSRKTGLIEWFLAQKNKISGYKNAMYSGFTTTEMSRIIERVLTTNASLSGVYHVASRPISKFDLLKIFLDKLGDRELVITANEDFHCDRSLNGSLFIQKTGYEPPTWDQMLGELASQYKKKGRNYDV